MWFVSEQHSMELGELGRLEGVAGAEQLKAFADELASNKHLTFEERWQAMSSKICVSPT